MASPSNFCPVNAAAPHFAKKKGEKIKKHFLVRVARLSREDFNKKSLNR